MNDRATLLANCLAEPADDTARLVYADWLREQDDPATRALGAFVWAGVTLAGFRGTEPVTDRMFFDAQHEMNENAPGVLSRQLPNLLAWDGDHIGWDQDDEAPDRVAAARIPPPTGDSRRVLRARRQLQAARGPLAVYERGMLTAVRLPIAEWRTRCAGLLAVCPLRSVGVTDVPGLTLHVFGPEGGWRLLGELMTPGTSGTPSIFRSSIPTPFIEMAERAEFVKRAGRYTTAVLLALQTQAGDRWPGPDLEYVPALADDLFGPITNAHLYSEGHT